MAQQFYEINSNFSPVFNTANALIKERGDNEICNIMVGAQVSVVNTEYDNWNGGTYGYTVYVSLPVKLYSALSHERITEVEKVIGDSLNEVSGDENSYFHVKITPILSGGDIDWETIGGDIGKNKLKQNIETIRNKAVEHKNTVCIGRSHGIHAEPMTFGVKLLSWLDHFERVKKRFDIAKEEIAQGQISGPVGTYSNISPEIEQIVCKKLGLTPAKISTQVIARDNHAYYLQSLALIASAIEQCAVEIRHLQRTEVLEVEEAFKKGQKGSSAMPHKKNPISSENLSGLARVVKSNAQAAMDNIALWHERDISHSSVERIIFPDSTILIDYMLNRFNKVVEGLVVHKDNMFKNTTLFGGIVYSQRVLLALTEKGLSREEAYSIVQRNALSAFNKQDGDFKNNLYNDASVTGILTPEEIENCFDSEYYLRNIDTIYKRFGL